MSDLWDSIKSLIKLFLDAMFNIARYTSKMYAAYLCAVLNVYTGEAGMGVTEQGP